MKLEIWVRQTQYYAIDTANGIVFGDPIIYSGLTPNALTPSTGTVPKPNWVNLTDYVSNLDEIKLTWTIERDSSGQSTPGAFQPTKSASSTLMFEDEAYKYVKDWLIDSISAPMNSIDVKIVDVGCGSYEEYLIKSTQITWCEDDVCEFKITIQQKDESLHCIQTTMITDNHQGWFPPDSEVPANGKKHPRFIYCNEAKPNGMMIALWGIIATVGAVIYMLTPIIWVIQAIVNIIWTIVAAFSWLFGGNVSFPTWSWFDPGESIGTYFLESSGCGRMHPAPLIRDYINNVCKKCGIVVDGQTSPIFHSNRIDIETSIGVRTDVENPYQNACYFYAPSKRGLRIFRGAFSSDMNLTDFWQNDNRPLLTLDMFLDQVKTLFNAEWRLKTINGVPHLYFWRKDWYTTGPALYDFSENSPDRNKILEGMCFNWSDKKQYGYMSGLYSHDGGDGCGDEALQYMNDMISIGDKTNNRTYEGALDKTSKFFGATRFRLDGASDDYIFNALQMNLNNSVLSPSTSPIFKFVLVPYLKKFADYALLLSNENAGLAKVIIWDPATGFDHAKAIRNKGTYDQSISGCPLPMPEVNPNYNQTWTKWCDIHDPNTHVQGSGWSFGSQIKGVYTAQEMLGVDIHTAFSELSNYPMFFASGFKDNLFDWFHWIDDPRKNPSLNLQWSVKIELCCDDLGDVREDGRQGLGVLNTAENTALYGRVILPMNYYNVGKITEITVSYDSGEDGSIGKYIELKGIT